MMLPPWSTGSLPQERFSLLVLAGGQVEQQAFAGELVWRKPSFPFFQIILKFGVRNKLKGFPKPSIPPPFSFLETALQKHIKSHPISVPILMTSPRYSWH